MKKLVPVVGFLILSALVLFLFGSTAYEAWLVQPLGGIVMALVLLGLLLTIVREGQGLPQVRSDTVFTQKNLLNFVSVFCGALIVYTLAGDVGLGAVVAAGLVAVVAALVLPDYGVPLYCGAFAGMASRDLLATHGELAIAGAAAGLVYVLTTGVFGGVGGKLGTIAVAGVVTAALGLGCQFGQARIPGWDAGWLIVVLSVVAAAITYWLNHNLKHGGVMASGIVGLVGGLVLPGLYPEAGRTLGVVVICASFAGMSAQKRSPSIVTMAIAGLVAGLVFVYSTPLLCGAGGKLGTIAFGSVMAVEGYRRLITRKG